MQKKTFTKIETGGGKRAIRVELTRAYNANGEIIADETSLYISIEANQDSEESKFLGAHVSKGELEVLINELVSARTVMENHSYGRSELVNINQFSEL